MRRPALLAVASILLLLLGAAGGVALQTSESFESIWSRISNGWGQRQSSSYVLEDTVGQWVAGESQSSSYRVVADYWVPEPSAPLLGGSALLLLSALARQRHSRRSNP